MRFPISLLIALCCQPLSAAPLLLISIDGLHPRYVTKSQDPDLQIPNLRSFLTGGAYADGAVAMVPTVTYPNHTTLVTGVSPSQHGILSNTTFDPLGKNREGWYWYAEDIKVPTLWSAASAAKLSTASVNWPVTVGDRNIQYLLPEFWRTSTPDDLKAIRALSRPEGMLAQMESRLGAFVDGNTGTLDSDRVRTKFAVALLKERKPDFLAVHLIALDEIEHEHGPFVATAYKTLTELDRMIGELTQAALASHPDSVVAIASDHGFIATHTAVNLRTSFVAAGLIKLKQQAGAVAIDSWDAQVWSGAASAAVVLQKPGDAAVSSRVEKLLNELKADPRNGIARVLDRKQTAATGGFAGADFLVEFAPGFYLGGALKGELLEPATSHGTHGYLPDREEMHSSFFIKGRGIAKAKALGTVDMKQIAPTLAGVLGVSLPSAQSKALAVAVQ
jgi:predicted AlkP superfamily pyrophosphatase or phosphodiesterase